MTISDVLSQSETNIFSFLSPLDLLSCTQVCKKWKILASKDVLWKRFLIDNPKINEAPDSRKDLLANHIIISFQSMFDFFKANVAMLRPNQEVFISYFFLFNPGWYATISCKIVPKNTLPEVIFPISAAFAKKIATQVEEEIVEKFPSVFVDGKPNCITLKATFCLSKHIWNSVLSGKITEIFSAIAFEKQDELAHSHPPSRQGNKRQRNG